MTEIDPSLAVSSRVALAYTSSQWWLTVTTALVIATYLAARHSYGVRLTALRVANHEIGAASEPGALSRDLNIFLNLSIFAV